MIDLRHGDMRDVLPTLEAESVHSCVTDPPYGLEFMGKDWDAPWKYGMREYGMTDTKGRRAGPSFTSSRNPMCQTCHKHKRGSKSHVACACEAPAFDETEHRLRDVQGFQAFNEDWARAVYRVLKPGGYLLAMGGTRTFHRLACAIEDAGFEVRDTIAWVYGSGFPKSLDIGKAIDRTEGHWRGRRGEVTSSNAAMSGPNYTRSDKGEAVTAAARQWNGWGTSLKPAMEMVCVARKPLSERTVAGNVLRHGTGGINVDACRVAGTPEPTRFDPAKHGHEGYRMTATGAECAAAASPLGRYPANLCHDGSPEVEAAFAAFGESKSTDTVLPQQGWIIRCQTPIRARLYSAESVPRKHLATPMLELLLAFSRNAVIIKMNGTHISMRAVWDRLSTQEANNSFLLSLMQWRGQRRRGRSCLKVTRDKIRASRTAN